MKCSVLLPPSLILLLVIFSSLYDAQLYIRVKYVNAETTDRSNERTTGVKSKKKKKKEERKTEDQGGIIIYVSR